MVALVIKHSDVAPKDSLKVHVSERQTCVFERSAAAPSQTI